MGKGCWGVGAEDSRPALQHIPADGVVQQPLSYSGIHSCQHIIQ